MKTAGTFADALLRPARLLGSVSGASAPRIFRGIGGPATGALVQSLLFGGAGYAGGKLVNKLTGRKTKAPATLAALGVAGGLLPNVIPMAANVRRFGWRGLNYSPADLTMPELRKAGYVVSCAPEELERVNRRRATVRKLSRGCGIKQAAVSGGYGVPIAYTEGMIMADPLLSPTEKAKAIAVLDEAAGGRRSGIITLPNLARAGVGAGLGYAGGTLFAKVVDSLFGGVSSQSQRRLQQVGLVGGVLRGLGVV